MIHSPIEPFSSERHSDYLRDESRKTGEASQVAFPLSEADVIDVLTNSRGPVTTQGARTGITGGAVPQSGLVLNMSHMNSILGVRETGCPDAPFSVIVQTGITLKTLRDAVARGGSNENTHLSAESLRAVSPLHAQDCSFFFAPDPTEDTASIGGMLACNASGARSYKYGPTRCHVLALNIVTASGDSLSLRRGQHRASAFSFELAGTNRHYCGTIPSYEMPKVKNAAGYYAAKDMDLLDLFVGSEGTLGIITEAELALRPAPAFTWAVMAFFAEEDASLKFVTKCKTLRMNAIAAVEFFDGNALSLLRSCKEGNPAFSFLPDIPNAASVCVYVEIDGDEESVVEAAAMEIAEVIEWAGGTESDTWMATEPPEMDKMKKFRHALPEAVNLKIDTHRKIEPAITKLGTDFAVPPEHLDAMLSIYRRDLAASDLEYVIFGHIGNDHLHVNIMPKDLQEYERGKRLYMAWARRAVEFGGTVSAEHGIGKLKTAFLLEMYGAAAVDEMKRVKSVFDPDNRLNPGNLF